MSQTEAVLVSFFFAYSLVSVTYKDVLDDSMEKSFRNVVLFLEMSCLFHVDFIHFLKTSNIFFYLAAY